MKPTILVCLSGMSPAVITETVWALAHEPSPILPTRIICLTTSKGKEQIESQLFSPPSIWESLRASLLGPDAPSDPRLLFLPSTDFVKVARRSTIDTLPENSEIAEIATSSDSAAFGDFVLDELWPLIDAPDTRIILSIAGGYKTMSALAFSCFSLLARTGDRVTHVLVSTPYESPALSPRFYYPDQPNQTLLLNDSPHPAKNASVCLFDVPFVPMRYWFEEKHIAHPSSYSSLVARCSHPLDPHIDSSPIHLTIDTLFSAFSINGNPMVPLSLHELALLLCIAKNAADSLPPLHSFQQAALSCSSYLPKAHPPFNENILRQTLHQLRKKFTTYGFPALSQKLPRHGSFALDLPPDAITIRPSSS